MGCEKPGSCEWGKVANTQINLVGKIHKVKKAETRVKEIAVEYLSFRTRIIEVDKQVQSQLNWVDANSTFP